MEVELRDKNQPTKKQSAVGSERSMESVDVSMERVCASLILLSQHLFLKCLFASDFNNKILYTFRSQNLDDLLKKLSLYGDKTGNYYQVIFPVASGEPCKTTLHCLLELGIGEKINSSVRYACTHYHMQIEIG